MPRVVEKQAVSDLCGLDGSLPCKARRIAALRTSRITSPVTQVDYYQLVLL
jgi:hypothetical protein